MTTRIFAKISSPASLPSLSTRRRFLAAAAAAMASWQCGRWACGQAKGPAARKLEAYDELMAAFVREREPPGAALAVTHRGRLVYARGFGFADVEQRESVQPASLFRIASVSKPFTSAAVLHLVENGKLKLDDPVFPILRLEPLLERNAKMDPRWRDITVRHCLQHAGGWDRGKSFDPMGAGTAELVAEAFDVPLPIDHNQIIRYTMGKPLDSDPGTAYAYSNFGYCVLGRVIEAASGKPYREYVAENILAPLGIRRMRLGKNLLADRAPGEVKYYDGRNRRGRAISGPEIGRRAPLPYGVECLETMDANGGWIATAVELVRFAAALDDPEKCPILKKSSIEAMLAPPPGAIGRRRRGGAKPVYYACGWNVQPNPEQPARCAKWHDGLLAGSSTALVCRNDGIDWAVLFNGDADKSGVQFAGAINPLLHKLADEIAAWPDIDLFPKFL
ncbi:MAG: beta-lactamase family protein [Pirellulales bacterium]|nr:beta-lactamase family protein [Pirellulales bacterium]